MTTSNIRDRLTKLLLKQEFEIGNLPEIDEHIILVAATLAIPKDTPLTERAVTDRLIEWSATVGTNIHADAVEMRRYLVDARCLLRDAAGHTYTRPAQWPPKLKEIAAEMESLDVTSFAENVRREEIERRAERKKAALEKQHHDSKTK